MREFEFLNITLEDDDIADEFYCLFDYTPDTEDICMVKEKLTANNALYKAMMRTAKRMIWEAVTEQMLIINAIELRAKEEGV